MVQQESGASLFRKPPNILRNNSVEYKSQAPVEEGADNRTHDDAVLERISRRSGYTTADQYQPDHSGDLFWGWIRELCEFQSTVQTDKMALFPALRRQVSTEFSPDSIPPKMHGATRVISQFSDLPEIEFRPATAPLA